MDPETRQWPEAQREGGPVIDRQYLPHDQHLTQAFPPDVYYIALLER